MGTSTVRVYTDHISECSGQQDIGSLSTRRS